VKGAAGSQNPDGLRICAVGSEHGLLSMLMDRDGGSTTIVSRQSVKCCTSRSSLVNISDGLVFPPICSTSITPD